MQHGNSNEARIACAKNVQILVLEADTRQSTESLPPPPRLARGSRFIHPSFVSTSVDLRATLLPKRAGARAE